MTQNLTGLGWTQIELSAHSEMRTETCPDCHAERDRQWATRDIFKGVTVPDGWRVERRFSTGTRRIAAPTRWVTLCLCDD